MNAKTERIRALNDELRTTLRGGKVHATTGIAALGTERQAAIICAVQAFDAFTADNDPYKEHEFGLIEIVESGPRRSASPVAKFSEIVLAA